MARQKLTELDKLECAEYTIALLERTLREDSGRRFRAYDGETGDWINRARAEIRKRLSEYIGRVGFGQ